MLVHVFKFYDLGSNYLNLPGISFIYFHHIKID